MSALLPYTHEHSEVIIESALKFFEYSESAAKLLKAVEGSPYKIVTITGSPSQHFVPDDKTIIMRVPALYSAAKIEQAIDLAAGLAELDNLRDHGTPSATELTTQDYADKRFYRNLDVTLRVFETIEEWDDAGYRASLEISRMGLRSLYKAWQKDDEYQVLAEIYWKIIAE
jgi:hypothetical protein